MTTAKDTSKKVRREVKKHAGAIKDQVAQQVIVNLYMLPLYERTKWALKILRGVRKKAPLWHRAMQAVRWFGVPRLYAAWLRWRYKKRGINVKTK